MVSAYATTSGLCLGQEGTRGKGNEIAAIKALLDTLILKGCIVTIDAIGCQTEIAQKIADRGGDYLLAVKDIQGKLAGALREFFAEAEAGGFGALPVSWCETVEKDHGRIETRSAWWVNDLAWLDRPIRHRAIA
jgi:predicted transposase YbfD/YdcC